MSISPVKELSAHEVSQASAGHVPSPGSNSMKIDPLRYRTKMCRNFMNDGACPFQGRCVFAHTEEDLRTTEDNRVGGITTEEALRETQSRMQQLWLQNQRVVTVTNNKQSPTSCQCAQCMVKRNPEFELYRHNPYSFNPITFLRPSSPVSPTMDAPRGVTLP